MFRTQRYKEIKKLAYLFNSWVLIIYATSCVSLLSCVSHTKLQLLKKCYRSVRCLLKNAIRYLKNAIVKLDVCSEMPLDIVIFTSNLVNHVT